MRTAFIKNASGKADRVAALEVSEFPFFQVPELTRKAKNKKNITYLKTFATFDIETTTVQLDEEKAPEGFMYHWQMCIGGVVVYGRRWEEWLDLMHELSEWLDLNEERRMVIYVHNLAYEFQFIRDFLKDDLGGFEVFATSSRTPIYVMCGAGFEFRCSYKLTNMNLQKACENELGVNHPKAAGDLDYKKVRTAETSLNKTEFGYCVSDVVSLYELIEQRMINEGDTLDSIPLTSTGYVRRECRNACRKDRRYRDKVFLKQKMSTDVYTMLKEAGRGGNTHANRFMSGRLWYDVDSYDVVSSYPFQMLCRKMPASKLSYYGDVENTRELSDLLKDNACLFRVVLEDVKIKRGVTMPYIPTAKLLGHGVGRYDNGRVLECAWLAMTVTDIDWKIIASQYDYSRISISDFHIAKYDYMPEPIRQQVLSYFRRKSELKFDIKNAATPEEAANYKYLYDKQKDRLNGIFGMSYTDPVRDSITINGAEDWEITRPPLDESLEKFYKSRNNFLVYAHGVWITARAREHLQALLDMTGDNTIYCDTDSSKAIINDEIRAKIENANDNIRKECEQLGAYVDVEGERFHLGIYERETEKPYKNFKTLGAKKYAYTDDKGFHITISGVQKKLGAAEMKSIDNFVPGFIFREAGGKTLYYNDCEKHYITVNGCKMLTASNIGMVESTYELGLTAEYAELISLNVYEDLR